MTNPILEDLPLPSAAPRRRESLRRMLASRETLRQAFLLREILGPPLALRERLGDPESR